MYRQLVPCLLAFAVGTVALHSAPARAGQVTISVSGAVPNGTRVFVALCANSLELSSCARSDQRAARASAVDFAFTDVVPGRYAVAAFQDLDGNGTLTRTALGFPLEPYAFSNDAGRASRPTFSAAAVEIGEGGRHFGLRLRSLAPGAQ